jgi:hypothetical protein
MQDRVADPPLNVDDDLPGIGLVPTPIQVFSADCAPGKLPDKSAGLSPALSRQSRSKRFVVP